MFKIAFCWICFASVLTLTLSSSSDDYNYLEDVKSRKEKQNPPLQCNLPDDLKNEIASYTDIANQIINEAVSGSFQGRVYNELAYFADRFGHRIVGSQVLEDSIDFLVESMSNSGMSYARKEQISTPAWRRGEETLRLIQPIEASLSLLSFGYSIGTPSEGIQAEALVVTSLEDLKEKADQAPGKIIVFNQGYKSYEDATTYRGKAAPEAAKVGGVAALVRSITPFSLDTPHTGMMRYEDGVEKIPCVAITVEGADMLLRMAERNETIILHLTTETENTEDGISHNAIGGINGTVYPNEIVIVSGHIDSWDVGQGVVDDAAGVFVSTEVLNLLKHLDLTPKRTIEAIGWTSEEFGLHGAFGFMETHKDEIDKYVAAFESDTGTFRPLGLDYAGSDVAGCVVQEILKLLEPINATNFRSYPIVGTDISLLTEKGVPSLSLSTDSYETDEYFWYHHSAGDTMNALNSEELDLCLALWTVSSYVIADLSVALTQLPEIPGTTTTTEDSSVTTTTEDSSVTTTTEDSSVTTTTEDSSVTTTEGTSAGIEVVNSFTILFLCITLSFSENIGNWL